ncbi:MAG: hypothetical protein QGH45_19135, partial [Myxococcota bacterium]|nr:hypothetical protein [Myxococcota bacterium]
MTRTFAVPEALTVIVALACAPLVPLTACQDGPGDPPAAPDQDDASYEVIPPRTWNLIGNGATAGHDELWVEVVPPPDVEQIRPWIGDQPGELLAPDGDAFAGAVDIAGLGPGEHVMLLQADGADVAFAAVPFLRSHPLYLLTSVDWDDSDIVDHELEWHLELHEDHEHLRLTQFVGPYTFTDPYLAADRTEALVDWLDT